MAHGGCDPNATCDSSSGAVVCTCNGGYEGDGGACSSVAAALQGLSWQLPCVAPDTSNVCVTNSTTTTTATLTGAPGTYYLVGLHFRGVIETEGYSGGVEQPDGGGPPYWYTGGTPFYDQWNIYSLSISEPAQTFYLNEGPSGLYQVWPLDYLEQVVVAAGATVTLFGSADDNGPYEILNVGIDGGTVSVPGVTVVAQPFDGQFVQMDVEQVAPIDPCADGLRDQSESDVDCGGTCAPCQASQHCNAPSDCASGVCNTGACGP